MGKRQVICKTRPRDYKVRKCVDLQGRVSGEHPCEKSVQDGRLALGFTGIRKNKADPSWKLGL